MNFKRYNLLYVLVILLSSFNSINGQEATVEKEQLKKNSIYGNLGIAGNGVSVAGYYERMLTQAIKGRTKVCTFAKSGYGVIATPGGGSSYITGQYGLLIGGSSNYLEIGAGISYYFSGNVNKKRPYNALLG